MNDPTRFPDGTLKPYGAETCTKCAGDGEQATPGISCGACLGTGKKKTKLELAEADLKEAERELEYATGRYNRAVDWRDKAFAKVEEMKREGDHLL